MTDKLVFEADLDNSPILRAFEKVRSEALAIDKVMADLGKGSDLQAAMAQLATAATSSMQVVRQQLKTVETSVKAMQAQLASDAKAAGKALGDGVAAGVQESTGKVTSVVRAQAQWLQAAYEDELKKGVKFSSKDLMDFKAWGVNIGADARAGIYEGLLRAKSATSIDPRVLLGLTPDVMGKSAQASAEVFKESFQTALLKAKSASSVDPRTLLGLSPDMVAKSARDSADVFKEHFAQAAATSTMRAKSATSIDPRVLLGLTPDVMGKSAQASAEVFKESFQTALLKAKSASSVDPRTLLGLSPDVLVKSARASAEVFKEAGLLDAATKGLTKSQNDLNDAFRSGHSAARGLASGFGAMWLTWGQLGPILAGAALSNAFVQAIKLGSQFENTLAVIEHVGGQAAEEVAKLGEAALSLSRAGPYGPNEVATALKTMALAGLDAKESLSALKPMLDFALVGELGVEKATESAIAISKAFGYTAEGVSSVTDVIAKAAAVSMSSIGSMTEAFRQASTVAQQFGVSVKDASTTLALLSQVGIQGSAAGTAMRNMYTELLGMSKAARDILSNTLKIEVFDNAAKAMKPLSVILKDLSTSLKGMEFESQLRVLQKLGNERGLKALSADLVAFVTAAKNSGKEVVTVFEQIRSQLEDAPGFVAVAAVNMGLTTANQMKSVGSALQTSLVEAFQSVSTEVQRTSGVLREAFNSEEFRRGVASLISSLAGLVRFLVDNKEVLAAVGLGVVGGVSATAGFAAFGSLAAGIGAVASAAGVVTPALSLMLALLGPIGAALGVATAAYVLFGRTAKTASEKAAEVAATQYSATMEGIRAEQERLDKAIAATKAQLLGSDAVIAAEQNNAVERLRLLQEEQLAVEQTRHQHVLLNAQRTLGKIQGTEFENTAQGAAAVKAANAAVAASSDRLNEVWRKQEKQMGAMVAGFAGIKAGAKELASLQEQLAKKNSNRPTGPLMYDPAATSKHAAAMKEARSNELSQIEKFYNTQLSLLDKFNADASTRLKDELSAGLIEKGEYMARELKLTEQYETQKLQLLDKERAAYEAAYTNGVQKYLQDYDDWVNKHKGEKGFAEQQAKAFETLQQSLVNTSRAAETFFEKNDAEKAKAQDTAFTRMHKQTVELRGSIEKLKKDTREFWEAEEVLVKKAATQAGVEDALRYASPQAAAYISAAAKETERLTDRVYKYDAQIRQAEIDLEAFREGLGEEYILTNEIVEADKGRVDVLKALREERSKLLEAIPDRAAEKGKLAVEKYWKDWEADLVKGLTGAVMVGLFDGGKSGAKALRAVIVAELKRPIQVVVQALVQPVMSGINSALGFTGSGGSGGILGNIGTMGSIAQTAAGWLGLGGATAAGIATNVGIGTAAGLTVAEATAAASAAGAAAGSGLMTTLGPLLSAAPYLAAIAGVYQLAKNLDKSGTPHTGGGALYSASGGLRTHGQPNGWSGGGAFLTDFGGYKVSEDATKMAAQLTQSIVGILDSTATAFGQQAGYAAATAFADDTSSDGAWGALAIKLGDKMVAEWGQWANGPGGTTFSDGAAGSAEYLAKITGDVRTVLNGIDMPAWAKKVLNDLPDSATLQTLGEAVAVINKTQTAWSQLGKTLIGFAAMGDDAKVKLTAASGGIDALVTNANVYYENFYSEGERTAATLGSIKTAFAAVNVPMPATREAFRTLVESLQATADTNPYASAALATVLSLSGAFASVVPAAAAAEDATTTLVDTVEEIATLGRELDALRNPVRTIKDVAQSIFNLEKEGANLQVELLRTYGDSASLAAAAALQRDIETAGMTAQEIAQYDLNAARRAEIDTIVAARQAIADGVASWEAYFDLFGTPEEKQSRAKTRVQAVLPEWVDTVEEYRGYVYLLTEEFGVGSAEVKKATDVARDFSVAFPTVAEVIVSATEATKDLASYQANFYTAMERSGIELNKLKQTFATLGLEMPTTNAGFRALVEAQDLTTTSGITTFNTLMSVQDAFAKLYPMVEEVAVSATVLTTNLDAFHSGFFTAAEQTQIAGDNMTASLKALGLTTLPTTNAEFRDLALGIDTSTVAGKVLFNGLMELAGSFAKLYPMVEEVAVSATVLTTNLDAFHSGFFTAAEQTQIAGDNMTASLKALGLTTLPTTNAEFRDLALGIDTSTESGKLLFNGLMELAGSFAQLHPLVTTVTEVVQTLDGALAALRGSGSARTVEQIAGNMLTLEEQIFQLQNAGNTPALRQHLLDGLSDVKDSVTGLSERDLQGLVWALQDTAAATQQATDAASAAAQKGASEHDGLWRQWLTATGDTAALRALELAALDPANRALQENIWALQDQKAAADAQAEASRAAADAARESAQKIASEHDGLWRQWLTASGDTAALRALELAALDPSNRALQEQIWALEDQKTAAEAAAEASRTAAEESQRAADAAAAAAQKIAQEHDGLWRQWLTASGDTAALRALDLAALDPSNRALQEQIWALEDQKKAADDAAAAAEQLKSTWTSLSDSMMEEVRRIRGLIDESSGASYASLAAQFAVATAQTRAGDTDAAKLLPGLSQSMLAAYEATATSLVDLQRVRALTANSLEVTAGLTPGAPKEGYVGVVAPADFGPNTPAAQASAAAAAQTGELQALREEVAALRTALEAVVINTGKSSRLHQRWDDVGIPVTNTPDGAPLSVV